MELQLFSSYKKAWPLLQNAQILRESEYSQTLEWIQAEWKCLKRLRLIGGIAGKKYRIAVLLEASTPILIAPIYFKGRTAGIIGSESPTDVRDFTICKGCTQEAFLFFFVAMKNMGVRRFDIEAMNKRSLTRAFLEKLPAVAWERNAHNDPIIRADKTPEAWFSSLKKKVQDNIRYAERKLKRDGVAYRFEVLDSPFDTVKYLVAEKLHKRRVRQIRKATSSKMKLRYRGLEWLSKTGLNSRAILHASKAGLPGRLYMLYISGECAAAIIGFLSADGTLFQIPFLCYSDKFKSFSPGILLAKYMIQNELRNSVSVDFMLGDEKYKFDLGATNLYFDKCMIPLN